MDGAAIGVGAIFKERTADDPRGGAVDAEEPAAIEAALFGIAGGDGEAVEEGEGADGISGEAKTHIAIPMENPGPPSQGYILVLVRAATELDFPKDFIARIKAAGAGSLAA